MTRSKIAICALAVMAGTAGMVEAANFNDGNGKEWMQLQGTVGASWNQMAQTCPQDGVSPCTGSVNGSNLKDWVWATDVQVTELFRQFDPAAPVEGQAQFFTAQQFLGPFAFRPTFSFCETYFCGASAGGWTASKDATGAPIAGSVGWGNTNVSISGSFRMAPGASADDTSNVWLWRATGPGANAYDDVGSVASPDGGTAAPDVLANDWVAGAGAYLGNVALSQVSSTDPGVSLDTASGSVNVAAGTIAGTYTLSYRICDIASASCDDATVTVVVNPYVVSAANDSGWASPSTGGTAIASVLANDSLSGTPATIANVSLSLVSVSPADGGVTLDPGNGSVNVAKGTPLGAYTLVYQICDRTDPTNCAQATASVAVRNYFISALNDSARASSKTGSTPIASVLANDSFNVSRATTAVVQLSQVSPPVKGITLDTTTGAVSVAPKTPSGTYNIVYSICEIASPTNCASATITLDLSGKL